MTHKSTLKKKPSSGTTKSIQKTVRETVFTICIITVIVALETVYVHHRHVVEQQNAAKAAAEQQLQAQQAQQRQAEITNCENQLNAPYEATLMYDPGLNPNAGNQITQNDLQCQREY
jgi:uncharacterized protein HemX